MDLIKKCAQFEALAQQLQLYTPPTDIRIIHPIPREMVPLLKHFTLPHGGSSMNVFLDGLKQYGGMKDHAAVIAVRKGKNMTRQHIYGWALVNLRHNQHINTYVIPKLRRYGIAALLITHAKNLYKQVADEEYGDRLPYSHYKEKIREQPYPKPTQPVEFLLEQRSRELEMIEQVLVRIKQLRQEMQLGKKTSPFLYDDPNETLDRYNRYIEQHKAAIKYIDEELKNYIPNYNSQLSLFDRVNQYEAAAE